MHDCEPISSSISPVCFAFGPALESVQSSLVLSVVDSVIGVAAAAILDANFFDSFLINFPPLLLQ